MYISRIEKDNRNKYRIYSGDDYLFTLYSKELKKYNISEGVSITDDVMDYIFDEVICRRAKERALFLLEKQPYTEYMLRKKLQSDGYPDFVIDKVVSFLLQYNYLNDKEYALMFIRSYSGRKSRKQLGMALSGKGIDRNIVKNSLEEIYADPAYSDDICLKKQYYKYISSMDLNDPKVKQKIFRHFYGKGFTSESINNLMTIESDY